MSEPNPPYWRVCSICAEKGVQSAFCTFFSEKYYDEHMKEHEGKGEK